MRNQVPSVESCSSRWPLRKLLNSPPSPSTPNLCNNFLWKKTCKLVEQLLHSHLAKEKKSHTELVWEAENQFCHNLPLFHPWQQPMIGRGFMNLELCTSEEWSVHTLHWAIPLLRPAPRAFGFQKSGGHLHETQRAIQMWERAIIWKALRFYVKWLISSS